jgi:hypothetical protein
VQENSVVTLIRAQYWDMQEKENSVVKFAVFLSTFVNKFKIEADFEAIFQDKTF